MRRVVYFYYLEACGTTRREPSLLEMTAPLLCGESSVSRISSNWTTTLPDFGMISVSCVGEHTLESQKAAIHPFATPLVFRWTVIPACPRS